MDSNKELTLDQLKKNFTVDEAAFAWVGCYVDEPKDLILNALSLSASQKKHNLDWAEEQAFLYLKTVFDVAEEPGKAQKNLTDFEFYKAAILANCEITQDPSSYYDECRGLVNDGTAIERVTRQELIKLARKLGETPSFLLHKEGKVLAMQEPSYTTPYMKLLIDAANEFWNGVSPQDPKAPTNESVVIWVQEQGEMRGVNVSSNIAKAIATIVRHPDKPTGNQARVKPKKS